MALDPLEKGALMADQLKEDTTESLKKVMQDFSDKIRNLKAEILVEFDNQLKKVPDFSTKIYVLNDQLNSKIKDLEANTKEEIKKISKSDNLTSVKSELEVKFNEIRKEFRSRISNMGGGNMNRNILVESNPSTLGRYTDLNIKAGSNVTLAYVNNDSLKTTDLTITGSGGGTPGGSDTQVQFNNGGSFGGDADFTWNKTTNTLGLGASAIISWNSGAHTLYESPGDDDLVISGGGLRFITPASYLTLESGNALVLKNASNNASLTLANNGTSGNNALVISAPTSIFAGGAIGGYPLILRNVENSSSVQIANFQVARVDNLQANNDEAYISLTGKNTTPALIEFARLTWVMTDVTPASEDGRIDLYTMTAGTLTKQFSIESGTMALGTNSITMTGSLGTTGARLTKGWFTDLQVTNAIAGSITGNAATATALQNARTIGGVSFNGTANITVATATGGFTVSGGALALGANDLTMTGSLAATGARVTKGWFTDLEISNAPTLGGTAATGTGGLVLATAPTFASTINVVTGIKINGAAASGSYLRGNGTNFVATAPTQQTVQVFTTGSGTYTTPAGCTSLRVIILGSGAGGSGGGTAATNGGAGNTSSFGTSLFSATGGANQAGNGGAGSGGSINLGGGTGGAFVLGVGSNAVGGPGGCSAFGGAPHGVANGVPSAVGANTGSGGAGGGADTTHNGGAGGSAGGYCEGFITTPSATYSYVVGAGGAAGAAGTGGQNGGAGAAGIVIVYENYF